MGDPLQIPAKLEIDRIETLKVLSDPLRLEILKQVGILNKRGQRCTVKQIAALLKMPPTKLYYHINLLEEHGLLVVGDTQVVSGIIEKHYQVAAMNMSVNKNIMSMNEGDRSEQLDTIFSSIKEVVDSALSNLQESLSTIFDEVEREKVQAVPARNQVALDVRSDEIVLTREQAQDMVRQINQILEKFEPLSDQNLHSENPDALFFGITQMIVPLYQRSLPGDRPDESDPSE